MMMSLEGNRLFYKFCNRGFVWSEVYLSLLLNTWNIVNMLHKTETLALMPIIWFYWKDVCTANL